MAVSCAAGDSINAALGNPAKTLTIQITGLCDEDVEIRRDNVTLIGTSGPTTDGIRAVDTTNDLGAAVLVRDANNVRIENLKLTGAVFTGLFVQRSGQVNVIHCRLEGNGFRGANYFGDSFGSIEDTVITGNGTAASPDTLAAARGLQVSGAAISCDRCTITDNGPPGTGVGIYAIRGAQVAVRESTVSGLFATATDFAGQLSVQDSTLVGEINPAAGVGYAAYADTNSRLEVRRSTVSNSLAADNQSQLVLARVTQTVNDSLDQNFVLRHSHLDVSGVSTLLGTTAFASFANGVFRNNASLGDLACEAGSDALCTGLVTRTGSDCGLCPCTDADGDGFFAQEACGAPFDCNDSDPGAHPGAAEVCGDGGDNDCDGAVDEGCP